jgi:hypothetical protein
MASCASLDWPATGQPALAIAIDYKFKRLSGGARRNRTDDLLNAIQALSQLSYGPIAACPAAREHDGRKLGCGGGQFKG